MAIRDFLIFDDTTPVPEEAQLGSGDTARLMLDSARAMVVLTEAEADVFVIDTVAGIVTMSSVGVSGAIPTLAFYDTDCGDGDVSASIVVDATTTTTNIEEVDFSIYQQKTGTLTRTFFSDIDQGIWLYPLGESANPVSITTGGDLNIASKLTHDGDADTYLQFSADQLQLIVGGATAFNYDEGALNTLAIDQEGTADISFGGGNVFFGGAGGSSDGNVGIGNSSLEAWHTNLTAVQLGGNGAIMAESAQGASGFFHVIQNAYFDDTNNRWEYISTDQASIYTQGNGEHLFKVVTSGTADDPITWTTALTIANNANIGIETENLATWTSTVSALQVGGTAGLSSETTQADGTKTWVSANAYHSSSTDTWKYISTNASDEANSIMFSDGAVRFRTAIAGVADAGISWINQLVLQNNSGSLSATFGGDIIVPVGNKIHLELDQEYFISSGSTIQVFTGGAKRFTFETGAFRAANGGAIQNAGSSATVPTLTPNDDYTGYGIGGLISGGFISGIANSTEGWRLVEDTSNVTMHYPEATTPTAIASYWSIYGKADNLLYFQDGAGVEYTVGGTPSFKSYTVSDFGNSDSHYTAGFYSAPVEDVTLTIGGSVTQTYGTAGQSHAAHAFCVASGAGGTDLVLTVTGVSITDAGVKNDADSEIIVADTDTATTDAYYETSKKWLGQITYTLTGSAGAFTFNYGFCKYEDWGNRAFTLTDFETTGKMGASETGLNIELLHHKATGWTYHASAFVPGTGALTSLSTDHGTNNDVANDEHFAYKRASLATAVDGSASEGLVIKVTTAVNNSIDYMNSHIGVTL